MIVYMVSWHNIDVGTCREGGAEPIAAAVTWLCWTAGAVPSKSTYPPWNKASFSNSHHNNYHIIYPVEDHNHYDSSTLIKLKLVVLLMILYCMLSACVVST